MPFQSEKQRKYLWANEPEIARDWTDTYGSKIQKAKGGIMDTPRRHYFSGAYGQGAGDRGGDPRASAAENRAVGSGAANEAWSPGIQHSGSPQPKKTIPSTRDVIPKFSTSRWNFKSPVVQPKLSKFAQWAGKMRGGINPKTGRYYTQQEYEDKRNERRDRASIDRIRKTKGLYDTGVIDRDWDQSPLKARLANLENQFGITGIASGVNKAGGYPNIKGMNASQNNIIDPSGKVNYASMFGIPSLDRLGTGLSQIVANMPKYWSLPKNIRDAIRTGKNIPFAHGTKNLDDYAKLAKTGFQNLRTKYIPTIHDWLKGTNPFKAEGVFGAVGDDALKSATQYAKGTSLRGTPFGKVTGDVFQGAIDPAKAYINRGLTGVVQGRVPSAIANQAFNLPNASKMSKVLGTPALHKIAGRALPGANIALGGQAALQHFNEGDYGQAAMAALSMAPGPLGWAGLAGEYGLSALDNMAPINPYAPENTLVMNQGGLATLWPR